MTILPLVAYSVALLVLAPRLLSAGWTRRAPRATASLWIAAEAAALVSVTLLLLGLVVPLLSVGHAMLALLDFCRSAWDQVPHRLRSHFPDAVSGALVALMVARLVVATASVVVPQRRRRRALRHSVSAMGQPDQARGLTLVDVDLPAAWCIPGRRSSVCVTAGALQVLSVQETQAVVQHERAHLKARHHLLVTTVDVFDRAFPGVPLFREARNEMRKLVEMMADDSAARVAGESAVARALVHLADQTTPDVGLAAGGSTASERAWRLLSGRPPLAPWRRRFLAVLATALVVVPLALVAAPALADPGQHCQLAQRSGEMPQGRSSQVMLPNGAQDLP